MKQKQNNMKLQSIIWIY